MHIVVFPNSVYVSVVRVPSLNADYTSPSLRPYNQHNGPVPDFQKFPKKRIYCLCLVL